ncbi:MAG: hypothetical protein H7Y43_12980 [Akkermansiaceae bacterium]|nr:hypothetical protein [Verrucomicrobiales bacterium]
MRFWTQFLKAGLAITLLSNPAFGQNSTNDSPTIAAPAALTSIPLSKLPKAALKLLPREDIFDALSGSVLNRIYDHGDSNNVFLGFLNDLHLRPKLFQTASGGSDDNNTSLGFEFGYHKALARHVLNPDSRNPIGLSMTLDAQGEVAVEADKNPNNLIEAGGALHMFQGVGGIDPQYRPTREAQIKLDDLIDAAARHDQAARKQAIKEFMAHMAPHFFYDLQAHARIETDQQFDNKQFVYGGQLSLVFRDWRPRSEIGWFNLVDYPFALFRALAGREEFQPSGRTFPSVVLGLDQVNPSENGARLAIDPDEDSYSRVRVEVAFKTPLLRLEKETLYFTAAYRHFSELSASTAIKSAQVDDSDYFVATVDLPLHFNISYSTGKSPLDQQNDQVYAVGWNLNF